MEKNRKNQLPPATRILGLGLLILMGGVAGILGDRLYQRSESHTSTAIAGRVACSNGEPVTGVWVEPSNPDNRGWASWQSIHNGNGNVATFTAGLPYGKTGSYVLNVGCGGTPQNWEHNDATPPILVSAELVSVTCTDKQAIKYGSCAVVPLITADQP